MRSMKKIVAAVLSVAMISAFATTSFAAALDFTNEIEFSAKISPETVAPGEDITISFYVKDVNSSDGIELTNGGTYGVDFKVDASKFTYKSVTLGQNYGSKMFSSKTVGTDTYYTNIIEANATATLLDDEPIYTYVFTVNSNVTAGTYDVITGWLDPYVGDGDFNEALEYTQVADQVTVTGGEEGPTVTKGATANGITEYTFANVADTSKMKGKKILMTETPTYGSAITDKTRFKVTYNNEAPRYFGSDIWGKMAQGGGTISVQSTIKFGLIVEADKDASLFKFEIVGLQ